MTAQLLLFVWLSQISYQTEQFLLKKFFDPMLYLESDEMTALWQNDSLTFTFCMTFSNIIPNWTIFVKEVFWSNALFRKWRNDCIVTKRKLNFPFLSSFNPWAWNHHLDISLAISGYIWSSQAKTSSVIGIWNFFGFTDWQSDMSES